MNKISEGQDSISRKIIKNTVYNIAGSFWGIAIGLVLTPYIIYRIGLERFGIWAIIGTITAFFGLFDFGISTSFVKYIAEFYAKKEDEKISRLVVTSIIFYSLFAVVLILAAWCFARPVLNFMKIPAPIYDEVLCVLLIGIATLGLSQTLGVFSAIPFGLQRMGIPNKVGVVVSLFNIAGTIFVLEHGYGLIGLMINSACMLGISVVINIFVAFNLLPSLRITPRFFDRAILREIFYYGYKVQISNVEGMIIFQIDKVILAHFLNMSMVSLYQLGSTVVYYARSLPLLLISAIIPAVSELNARQDRERLYELYLRGTKYLALVSLPLLTYVFINADLIMFTWMGFGYGNSALVIKVLAPCYLINALSGAATSVALGVGKAGLLAKVALVQLLVNLTLSILLVIKIGFIGVAIATAISLSISAILFILLLHRYMHYSLLPFLRKAIAAPLAGSLFAGAVIIFLNSFIISQKFSRLTGPTVLVAEAVIFGIIYLAIVFKCNCLDRYDRKIIKSYIDIIKTMKMPGRIRPAQ